MQPTTIILFIPSLRLTKRVSYYIEEDISSSISAVIVTKMHVFIFTVTGIVIIFNEIYFETKIKERYVFNLKC